MNEEEVNNYTDCREDVSICQVHTEQLKFISYTNIFCIVRCSLI